MIFGGALSGHRAPLSRRVQCLPYDRHVVRRNTRTAGYALQLGWLVIYCTELECVSFQAIRAFESDPRAAQQLADLDFKRRINALVRISREHCQPSEHLEEWLLLWEKVSSFAEERKALLHNPMMINVYEDDHGNFEMARELHTFRKPSSRFDGKSMQAVVDAVRKAVTYSSAAFRLL